VFAAGCQVLSFKRLGEALESPGEFLLSDFSKMERGPLLHLAFQALDAYQVRWGVEVLE
jgi:ubiquitin-activating enzyme E1